MSLYTWTVIIAVVLAGLSLGHWLGGRLAGRDERLALRAALGLLAAALATLASLFLLPLVEPLVAGRDPVSHVAVLALAAFFAPSLFAGLLSPLLTKMALAAAPAAQAGRILGRMFALGAAGAILGTLAAGLLLIAWLGTAGSLLAIAALYALLALPFLAGRRRLLPLAVLAPAALLALLPGRLGLAAACLEESAYYCIRIDEVRFLGRPARILALDHLVHGVNDRADPQQLLSPYLQGVDELVRRRFPGPALSAFFVGGGAYTLPRAWLDRYAEGRFLVAEFDPAVTRLARERLWLPASPALEVRHADAREVLRRLPEERRFDVVFGDAFHDISIPQHLATDEFHAELARRLKPGGLYLVNVVDSLRQPRLLLSLARTLQRRFPVVELWLDLDALGAGPARTTWILLAGGEASRRGEIAARYGLPRRWVQVPLEEMAAWLPPGALVTLTDDYAPVDRLLGALLLDPDAAE